MQNHILNNIRSLKLIDGCKGGSSQVYALNPSSSVSSAAAVADKLPLHPNNHNHHHHHHRHNPSQDFEHLRSASYLHTTSVRFSSVCPESLLPYGLPSPDLIDPAIDPFIRAVDPVSALAASFRALSSSLPELRCALHLEQRSLLRAIHDPKLLRRCLRCSRVHAPNVHHKIVLSAWLRFERREDELDTSLSSSSSPSSTSWEERSHPLLTDRDPRGCKLLTDQSE